MKLTQILLILFILLAAFVLVLENSFPNEKPDEDSSGLERTECWFSQAVWDVFTRCYYMNVPEDHQQPNGRIIKFPVVYFNTTKLFSNKAPVLHLGGGGPGGPMYLDYSEGVDYIKQEHDDYSLNKGRDLIVIDVRGTGLAEPALACQHYVAGQPDLLSQDLTYKAEWERSKPTLLQCIEEYRRAGVELSHYNSIAVAEDVGLLADTIEQQQLVLFGVSYGAVYAQVVTRRFPERVQSMVLDSAAFPHISLDENYFNKMMAPYKALYNHCALVFSCNESALKTRERIWSIYNQLNQNPITMTVEDYNTGEPLTAVLNGDRFAASLISGVYTMDVFHELGQIIEELEQGKTDTFKPYFEGYVSYLLDPQWGDVSSMAHYCFETEPFIDYEQLNRDIDLLPTGYIQDSVKFSFESGDLCKAMGITTTDKSFEDNTHIKTPTLFLQGKYDSITPLADVKNEKSLFPNSQLLIYPSAHSVMTDNECAEISAAKFVEEPFTENLRCN